MKRYIILVLAVIMMISAAGCTAAPASTTAAGTTAPEKPAITSVADLAGKKLAVQEGTTGDAYATDEVEGAQVSRFKKVTDTAMELINGRVDAIILDEIPAKKLVEANPDKLMILQLSEPLTVEQYAVAVDKGQDELLAQLNDAIAQIRADGTFDTLFDIFITGEKGMDAIPAVPDYTPSEKLIMGTNAEFEPFEYYDDDNEITGFDVWMARHIAAKMGMELVIEDMPFDSLIAALNTGKVQFVAAGLTADDERRKNVDFTDDYFDSAQVIIVPKV